MEHIVFDIESNNEIWELIDKRFEHILIHKFNPHDTIEWYEADLKISNLDLKNIQVRNMEFDFLTNLEGLKEIINLNTNFLRIYQFNKPVADTLVIENLPEHSKDVILMNNGFKSSFFIDFEVLTISSFDLEYITMIKNNSLFSKRIEERRINIKNNLNTK